MTESIKSIGVKQVLHYLDSDPDANIPKILAWVDRFDRHDQIKEKRTTLHAVLEDHSSNWAADYGNKLNMDLETLDSIIVQGKKLGIFMYIYSGGEPLVRKNDIVTLCERHPECMFLAFTNATLIDEAFADTMLEVRNLSAKCAQAADNWEPVANRLWNERN